MHGAVGNVSMLVSVPCPPVIKSPATGKLYKMQTTAARPSVTKTVPILETKSSIIDPLVSKRPEKF